MVVPQAVTHYPHDSCLHLRIDLHGEVQSIIAYFYTPVARPPRHRPLGKGHLILLGIIGLKRGYRV